MYSGHVCCVKIMVLTLQKMVTGKVMKGSNVTKGGNVSNIANGSNSGWGHGQNC